ncbi:hypothetical protein WUBG_17646 [Wuchereria bancrofti]|uniref:Uncharacterized protein n=1 Tax=Wuchereria bancrofti TaxID=6293 RepID=J9DP88_WUCBA|nr:hypothetical protein WUBG_17646 [Wuchereria bancrofti]
MGNTLNAYMVRQVWHPTGAPGPPGDPRMQGPMGPPGERGEDGLPREQAILGRPVLFFFYLEDLDQLVHRD